jgi:NCAIR mutase (PurE)-related protein
MNRDQLRSLLEGVRRGEVAVEEALRALARMPYEDLGFAKVDHHRSLRKGFAEVVYGLGKTPEQVERIVDSLAGGGGTVLVTKSGPEAYERVRENHEDVEFHPASGVIIVNRPREALRPGTVLVVCAGTSDIPVAEEAALTAQAMGNKVSSLYDVGVAGLHRLLDHAEELMAASVIIVVAGMEGALPSAVAGLVGAPVIAVPTSTGYGASFGGLAALLAMLNSCASGVAVVNIDNGFGAGFLAGLINSRVAGQSPGAVPS